jgi:predicted kinase
METSEKEVRRKVIILVGIPGSGKTTLAKKLVKEGYLRLSADSIREELYGSENIQGNGNTVFKVFYDRLEEAIKDATLDIVIDNTNTKTKYRAEILNRVDTLKYDHEFWLVNTPLCQCLIRNKQRERYVPEEIIQRMFYSLQNSLSDLYNQGRVVIK